MNRRTIEKRAYDILHQAYGNTAEFRTGQLEAIVNVVAGKRALVVQKTGWGKSLVYFIATKILRECGAGPTLIISPLLALMDNQIESAVLLGVRAETISSTNKDYWDDVYEHMDAIDALNVSPEHLANEGFMQHLASIRNTQLIVVDEAHAISDWEHDFRPDYQRVSKLIEGLPGNVTILGTTATANNRVIRDIKRQLGEDLAIVRGNLVRENLAIQVNPAQTREQRLAWLAQVLNQNSILKKGQGIIYCLTHNDCVAVSETAQRIGQTPVSHLMYPKSETVRSSSHALESKSIKPCSTSSILEAVS